ncbi:MAG: hypothetical protein ACKVOU_07605 [Cytophagales bacterium]
MRTKSTFGILFIIRMNKLKDGKAPLHAKVSVDSIDCEDFAIITCNLPRFYEETAHVASFGKYSKFGGHCLCFWKIKGKVPSYATNWYKISNRKTGTNDTYIPID